MPAPSILRGKSVKIMSLFAVIVICYFYSSLQRISSGVILPHMGKAYGFSASLVGFLSSLFFYSYGLTQNVWGAISDRTGPVRSCAIGIAMAAVGSSLLLVSPSPILIGMSRFFCGLGLAAYFTGIYIYAALAFPIEEYPFWVGFVQVIGNLGTVAAVAPLGILMDRLGYRGVFLIFTVWALCAAIILWLCRNMNIELDGAPPDKTRTAGGLLGLLADTWKDIRHGLAFIVGNKSLRLIVYAWSIVSAAVITLQGLWGVSWISVSSGAGEETARFWTTWVSIGLVIGAMCGARFAQKSKDIRSGMLMTLAPLGAAWCAYMASALLGLPAHVMGTIGFFIGVGSSTCMVFSISTLKSLVPISRAGLAIGTGQMLLYIAVIVLQWGSGVIINQFPGETAGSYLNAGFALAFGIAVLIIWHSAFLTWRMPEFSKADME
ncbi:MAG: MFS transporter [Synergistaceae bacterium]|nr:MFS transporter [Synergistaceae bacterium]